MDRNSNDRIDVDGHPENTRRELHMQPGRLEDIETPEAYATRTGQRDVTGEMPGRSGQGGRPRDVTAGEDLGHGLRAQPADGLRGADRRINRGEDIGNGIRARRADEQDPGNPLV
jgi:hypothetical protein